MRQSFTFMIVKTHQSILDHRVGIESETVEMWRAKQYGEAINCMGPMDTAVHIVCLIYIYNVEK